MKKINPDPDGWASFWIPAAAAGIITTIICIVLWISTTRAVRQVESNINKKLEILTDPVYVPKYDSLTQSIIDSIEIGRKISHDHIDNYYDDELQNVLDTVFNAQVD